MAVIAVYSVKGGVGKTTIAANLAWFSSAVSCRRTLLWDLDAAGGTGFLLGLDSGRGAMAEGIFAKDSAPQDLIRRTAFDRLDVLPADRSLRGLDSLLARIGKRKRLAKITGELGHEYERIVLDCPPVLNEISAQVIRAADCIIVPLPPSPLSTRAFETVIEEIRIHAKRHPPILPVLSMLDLRRNLHRAACEANPEWAVIPLASVLEQCAVQRAPVGTFAASSPGAKALGQLWSGIERKLVSAP